MLTGHCLCEKVEFQCDITTPIKAYQSHCLQSKKQTGTTHSMGTIIARNNIKWIRGTGFIKKWKNEAGFQSHFCGQCGSPVPHDIDANYVWVPIGSLDLASTLQTDNLDGNDNLDGKDNGNVEFQIVLIADVSLNSSTTIQPTEDSTLKFDTLPTIETLYDILNTDS